MNPTGRGIEMQKIVSVDGEDYKLHMFSPTPALMLAGKLSKFVLEPVAAMAGASGDQQKASEALVVCARSLMQNLNVPEVISVIKELMTCVTYQNKNISFDLHFMGRLGHLSKLVLEVVKFQYQDFSSAIGHTIAEMKAKNE